MCMRDYNLNSVVERKVQEKFKQNFSDTGFENFKKIVIPNYDILGKFIALRFIEWCQLNPAGLVSLATGKTPTSFIKWVQFYIEKWSNIEVQQDLAEWGINQNLKPDFSKLILVQMDEYFPINSSDPKSFFSYIHLNYLKKLGFKPENALRMDISGHCKNNGIVLEEIFPSGNVDLMLKFRSPQNAVECLQLRALMCADQFASDFETKIKSLGGIGFFLGGIGPDGHIAFNFRGSEHCSITRILPINYESAAVAAAGFGGMEFIRNKAVLTIGLGTITQNTTTTAIILADGVGKASVVKDAIEGDISIQYPATALSCLSGARFYLTSNAASQLKTQQFINYQATSDKISEWGEQIIIDLAIQKNYSIDQLTNKDVEQCFFAPLFQQNKLDVAVFISQTIEDLKQKIKKSRETFTGKTFLHTSPHPDDALLGCFPIINQLTKQPDISHYFATMTSGSNAVQNDYFGQILNNLEQHINFITPISKERASDLNDYLSGVIQNDEELKALAFSSRMLRDFAKLMKIALDDANLIGAVKNKIIEIKKLILCDSANDFIVSLKSCIREWEEELVWGYFGFGPSNVFHLNLGFYSSNDKDIVFDRDVQPVLNLLKKIQPDIITVALDPKDGGHATHYRVAEIIAQALAVYKSNKSIEVWGYNNVWCKFTPTQANIFFPVSVNDALVGGHVFNACYKSQIKAVVPSPELDGPFCDLAQKIMVHQFKQIKTCLGKRFFLENTDKQIAAAKGLCFIKALSVNEFIERMQNDKNN